MRLYRVHYSIDGGNSNGFTWHASLRGANVAARQAVDNDPKEYELKGEGPDIEPVIFNLTKQDVLRVLNQYASQAHNG